MPVGHRVHRRQLGALGQDALLDHPRQHPLAVGLVAVVELRPCTCRPTPAATWCGAWFAPGQNHMNHGRDGARRLDVADHLDRLVGEVLREVVALLRRVRLVDRGGCRPEVGIPLVRLAAEEAVEAVEALVQRPVLLRRARVQVVDRHVVVLAEPERAPAGLAHHLGERAALRRDVRVRAREADRALGDAGHAVLVVVAPGQEARARRRAERGRVPLRVRQPVVGEPLQRRHLDPAAERRPGREARCRRTARSGRSARPSGARGGDERLPVGHRVRGRRA